MRTPCHPPHRCAKRGTPVCLRLRDGSLVRGKYLETTANMLIYLNVDGERVRYASDKIDRFMILKGGQYGHNHLSLGQCHDR